ncbi:MAG TPA: protein usg [Hyphomicrobiaceae bacterium]|nr:protein usg [Hyphomicrobiaceae bacterium]
MPQRDGDKDFTAQLDGFSLTTAEILYHLPDHPSLLQSYLWQEYDMAPKFPKLKGFLDFWSRNLDGRLNRIRVMHRSLITPREYRLLAGELKLH